MDTSTQNNVINIRNATLNGPKITQTQPDLDEKARDVFPYCHGFVMNAIANMLNASPATSRQGIRNFAEVHAGPRVPQPTDALALEHDEMWHSLKKTNFGCGKFCVGIPENSTRGLVLIPQRRYNRNSLSLTCNVPRRKTYLKLFSEDIVKW